MKAFRALLRAETSVFFRDVASVTFTFLFPLLFIVLFGLLMSGMGGASEAKLGLVIEGGARAGELDSVVADVGLALVRRFGTADELRGAILERDVDFGAVWDGATLTFVYDVRRTQENFTFEELARGMAARFDLANQGLEPVIRVSAVVEGGEASADWFALVVPGILAFSILASGLFAVSEAAAVTAVYVLVVEVLIYREIPLRRLPGHSGSLSRHCGRLLWLERWLS